VRYALFVERLAFQFIFVFSDKIGLLCLLQ
jgi:hypothetical protein